VLCNEYLFKTTYQQTLNHIEKLTKQKPWSKKAADETYYHCEDKLDTRNTVSVHVGDWRRSSKTTFRTKDSKHPAVQTLVNEVWAYHEVIQAYYLYLLT
jgi:hypothetical protein